MSNAERFFALFDRIVGGYPLHMECYYSRTMDWIVKVWKTGCAADYPDAEKEGNDVVLVHVWTCVMDEAFELAHRLLAEWLQRFEPRWYETAVSYDETHDDQ